MARSPKKELSSWQKIMVAQKKEARKARKTPRKLPIDWDEDEKSKKTKGSSMSQTFTRDLKDDVDEEDEDDSLGTPRAPRELGLGDLLKSMKDLAAKNKARRANSEVDRRAEAARVEIRLQFEEEQRAYLAAEAHKEAVAQLKDELRAQTIEELRGEIYDQGVKDFLALNEETMKQQLEAHLLAHLTEHLPAQLAAELKPKVEQKLRRELEGEVRAQLTEELSAKLAPKIEAELKPKIEERLRKELGARLEKEQLAKSDPISPLVQPEIDGISYPDLKRASADDDFSHTTKRRRPSYDYDGEHEDDHEGRVANILEEALQRDIHRTDGHPGPYGSTTPPPHDAPGTSLFVSPFSSAHGYESTEEEGEEPGAPDEDEIFDMRAYNRPWPVDPNEGRWASATPSSHSASPPADEGDEGDDFWEGEVAAYGGGESGEEEEDDEEDEEEDDEEDEEEEEGGEGVEGRGSSKEDAILLDSDPE